MGKESKYIASGGFTEKEYRTTAIIADGNITGKIIEPYENTDHSSLPKYSNKSKIYFLRDPEQGDQTMQMRIYVDRKAAFDFDWGHPHGKFKQGEVHVHVWYEDKNGKWVGRGKGKHDARPMTKDEIAMYGGLIKKVYPNAKF